MKKLKIIFIAASLFAMIPFASQSQFYFGLSGGGLSSVITNQNNYGLPDMDYKVTFGGSGSLVVGYDFTKNIGLNLQIGYQKLGQQYFDDVDDTSYTRNVKLNYLSIPLLFKYKSSGEIVRFYLLAGPQFNYLMSAKQTYYKNDTPSEDEFYNPSLEQWEKIGEETITDRYNSIDIFARADFGVEVTIIKGLFANAGLSMGYGLMDINASDWQVEDASGNYNSFAQPLRRTPLWDLLPAEITYFLIDSLSSSPIKGISSRTIVRIMLRK